MNSLRCIVQCLVHNRHSEKLAINCKTILSLYSFMDGKFPCLQAVSINERNGGAGGPDLNGRLMLRRAWSRRCDFQNLLQGSVTPGPSMAPEKVNTFYIFSSSPYVFNYFSKPCFQLAQSLGQILSCEVCSFSFLSPPYLSSGEASSTFSSRSQTSTKGVENSGLAGANQE